MFRRHARRHARCGAGERGAAAAANIQQSTVSAACSSRQRRVWGVRIRTSMPACSVCLSDVQPHSCHLASPPAPLPPSPPSAPPPPSPPSPRYCLARPLHLPLLQWGLAVYIAVVQNSLADMVPRAVKLFLVHQVRGHCCGKWGFLPRGLQAWQGRRGGSTGAIIMLLACSAVLAAQTRSASRSAADGALLQPTALYCSLEGEMYMRSTKSCRCCHRRPAR